MIFSRKIAILIFLMGIFGIVIFACTKKIGKKIDPVTTTSSINACGTPAAVSFSADILPILNANCNIPSCHSGGSPSGNLDLDASVAYVKLMKPGSGYIDTINPNSSLLYSQLNNSSNFMPPSGKLSDCKITLVLKWIEQKAKNN